MSDEHKEDDGALHPLSERMRLSIGCLGAASSRPRTRRRFRRQFIAVWRALPASARGVLARYWLSYEGAVFAIVDTLPCVQDGRPWWLFVPRDTTADIHTVFCNGRLLPRLNDAMAETLIASLLANLVLHALGVSESDDERAAATALGESWGFPVKRLDTDLARYAR